MPLDFQPATPIVNLDIAQGYGALQQDQRNRDFNLQRSKAQADLDMQGQQLAQRGYEFDANQEAQQQYQESSQRHQLELQQQGASLQGQLQSQRLTQLEQQRMTQMQNSFAMVDTMNIGPEAKADLKFQIQTGGLSELQNRVAQQNAQDRHDLVQQQMQQSAAQTSILKHNDSFLADPSTNVRALNHPTTGEPMGVFQRNSHTGVWEPMLDADGMPIGHGGRAAVAGGADRASLSDDAYLKHLQEVERAVDAIYYPHGAAGAAPKANEGAFGQREQTDANGRVIISRDESGNIVPTPRVNITRDEEIARRLAARGLPPSYSEHQANRITQRATPIPFGTPETRLTGTQRGALNDLDVARQQLQRSGASNSVIDTVNAMEQLYRRYGSRDAMPYVERQRLDRMAQHVARARSALVGDQTDQEWDQQNFGGQ